jgi:hypothetical protein
MRKKTEKMTSSQFINELPEEWEDFNCPAPDPDKLEKILAEIVDSFSDLIHGAAFNFLLTEGKSTEFNFPFDRQDPKPPKGDEFSDWKMRWYSILDPWFLMLLQRRAEKFDLLKSDSQADAKTLQAFQTVRKTSNDLMFCVEQLSFYLGTFMGAKLAGASRDQMLMMARSLRRTLIRGEAAE